MLMGRFEYSLDAKGRVNFPPKFRAEMGDVLYVTKWFDKCLVVYSREQWKKMDEKFENMSTVRSKDILRILYGNVAEVVPDKQGRILLPQYLRDHAGITRDVVVIGARTYAEMWDKDTYRENEGVNNFASITEQLKELGF